MEPVSYGDVDAMLEIEERVFPFPWTRGNFVDSLASGYTAWGCRLAGQLVGYFVLMIALDESHLLNLSVAQAHQGVGIGASLLGQSMFVARRSGATSLLLEVRPSNTRALALYEYFGFERIGVRRGYYPAASGREDALVMRKLLAARLA